MIRIMYLSIFYLQIFFLSSLFQKTFSFNFKLSSIQFEGPFEVHCRNNNNIVFDNYESVSYHTNSEKLIIGSDDIMQVYLFQFSFF